MMTFDAHTLEQVNEVRLRGAVLLSGVNAAGTMFVVAAVKTNSATLVNATTGLRIAALNGGNDDMVLYAATLDPTTDTVIVADQTHASIYGISLNNSLLWTIALPADQLAVESLAVDQQGRSLYAFIVVASDDVYFPTLRYVQYSLSTHSEVASFNITDNVIDPQAPFAAGPMNGEIYVANAMYGTVERITMKSGATQSTSLSRYPFLARLTGLASLNGSSIAAFTVAPFVLYDISSEGRVLRRTQVASVHVCGDTLGSPFNIDVDMHGNIYIPLCSLGVHVYSPEHKLLHVIHTPHDTSPVGVAASWSGEYVYVIYFDEPIDPKPETQLWEVATGKFVVNFTDPNAASAPTAVAVDISDDSLWVLDGTSWYHYAPHHNATLVASYFVNVVGFNVAIDSQHRRVVLPIDNDQHQDRLEWYNMADASLVQQFQYPSGAWYGAGAVAVTKDGALTIAVERVNGIFYFFRNDNGVSTNTAERSQQQQPVGAKALLFPDALSTPSHISSLPTGPLPTSSVVFHAAQFGAVVDDSIDDTSSLQHAIDAAILAGPHTAVQLEAGRYDINASLRVDNAHYFTLAGVSSSSTLLLVHAVSGAISYSNCQHITFADFSIDFAADYWPFTAGHITNLSATPPYTFDLSVVPPHPVQSNMTSSAIFVYDPNNSRPAAGPDTYELFQSVEPSRGSTIVGEGVVRFALEWRSELKVGQAVVVRYEGGPHAISGMDCYDVTLKGVVVYTAHDMSHASNRIHSLTVLDYHVKKGKGRWLSTYADCMHFGDCRSHINFINSSCEGMGDDGLNVHNYFFNVTTVVNGTTVILSLLHIPGWLDTLNVGVGTSMTFSHAATPFVQYSSHEISALRQHSSSSYMYTFTTPIANVALYDLAYVSNTAHLLLSNFTVKNNRARGVLLETHNVSIERSLFSHTSGPALLFQPSMYWGEAVEGADVTVRDTAFEGCNQGIAQQQGVIAILPDPVQLMGVIDNITIERSTFLQGQNSGAVLQDWNGAGVTLHDNWIAGNFSLTAGTAAAPVLVCNSRGLRVRHNRAWNGSGVDYAMESSGVCDDSLSTDLYFSVDAFNATFAPHVMPAPSGYGVVLLDTADDSNGEEESGRESSLLQADMWTTVE